MQVVVNRKDIIFNPDPTRVIARFLFAGEKRALNTIRTVLEMSEEAASLTLKQTLRDYSMRHRNISKVFDNLVINSTDKLLTADVSTDKTFGKDNKSRICSYP